MSFFGIPLLLPFKKIDLTSRKIQTAHAKQCKEKHHLFHPTTVDAICRFSVPKKSGAHSTGNGE
jgi:hypothetical protein